MYGGSALCATALQNSLLQCFERRFFEGPANPFTSHATSDACWVCRYWLALSCRLGAVVPSLGYALLCRTAGLSGAAIFEQSSWGGAAARQCVIPDACAHVSGRQRMLFMYANGRSALAVTQRFLGPPPITTVRTHKM